MLPVACAGGAAFARSPVAVACTAISLCCHGWVDDRLYVARDPLCMHGGLFGTVSYEPNVVCVHRLVAIRKCTRSNRSASSTKRGIHGNQWSGAHNTATTMALLFCAMPTTTILAPHVLILYTLEPQWHNKGEACVHNLCAVRPAAGGTDCWNWDMQPSDFLPSATPPGGSPAIGRPPRHCIK